MSDVGTKLASEGAAKKKPTPVEAFKLPRWLWWLRELFAFGFWGLVIASWFYDGQALVTKLAPELATLYDYKFLALVLLFLLTWAFISFPKAFSFLYIIGYPFVWLGRLIKALGKRFQILFTFLPAFHSIAKPFKLNVAIFAIAIVSLLAILTSTSKFWIGAGMVGLGIYLISHFLRRFCHAFAKSTVFSELAEAVPKVWASAKNTTPAPPPADLEPGTEDYAKRAHFILLPLYALSTAAFLATTWLARQISAKRMYIYLIVALAYTTVMTILVFALEFYGLSKLVPGSFSVANPSFVDLLSFSFANLVFSDIAAVEAVSGYAIGLGQAQHAFSLLIGGFILSIFATLSNQRYTEDVNKLRSELDRINQEFAGFIEESYALTLVMLEELLIEVEPITAKWVLRLRYGRDWKSTRQLDPKKAEEREIIDAQFEEVKSSSTSESEAGAQERGAKTPTASHRDDEPEKSADG